MPTFDEMAKNLKLQQTQQPTQQPEQKPSLLSFLGNHLLLHIKHLERHRLEE